MPTLLDHPPIPTDEEWADILDALTRREFLTGSVAAGALGLGLAAWGSSATKAGAESNDRRIDTARGMIEVPGDPRRVVCLDVISLQAVLDVGVTPIGTLKPGTKPLLPDYARQVRPITKVSGTDGTINLEKVAALQPDLIVGVDIDQNYRDLTKIAPTALYSFTAGGQWAQLSGEFANAVNRHGQLGTLTGRYQQRARTIRAAHPKLLANTKWAIVAALNNQLLVFVPDSAAGEVLTELGGRFTPLAAGKTGNSLQLSFEKIGELAAADAIVIPGQNNGQPVSTLQPLLNSPLWSKLPAVKEHKVYPLAGFYPSSYGGAIDLLDEFNTVLGKLPGGHR